MSSDLHYASIMQLHQPHPPSQDTCVREFKHCATNTTDFMQVSQKLNAWGNQVS